LKQFFQRQSFLFLFFHFPIRSIFSNCYFFSTGFFTSI
jgi:hypothetical protein